MPTPLVKPATLLEPWARIGSKNTIPQAPTATPGAASLDLGFPPLTMTAVSSGGVPPSGLDMNGILNLITQHTAWANAGGIFTFDAALSTFIGGYPIGAVLQSNDGLSSYVNVLANNATDFNTTPAAIGVSWMPYGGAAVAASGSTAIATTGGTTTLTGLQAARQTIVVSGTLASNATIVFPNTIRNWTVINNTTGAFTLTCKSASTSGVTVTQGKTDGITFNGTAIVYGQADVPTQSPGDNTLAAANTAFVEAARVLLVNGYTAAIAAALVNTALTGNPTAPTQSPNNNSTRLATTAYVDAAVTAVNSAVVPQYKNANFTVGASGNFWVDTSAGAITVTLPDPPTAQNLIDFRDIGGAWSVYPMTINPGTKTILGTAATLVCDVSGEFFGMYYNGSDWKLT